MMEISFIDQWTAIGLLTNYLDFFIIVLFHEKVVKTKHYFEKKYYLLSFSDKKVRFFLENKLNDKVFIANFFNKFVKYYKLPYTGHTSTDVKRNLKLCTIYYEKLNIKFVLSPFKVGDIFNVKGPIPRL